MTEQFELFIVSVIVGFAFVAGIWVGNENGKKVICKQYNAELYEGKCVVVERKEIKL